MLICSLLIRNWDDEVYLKDMQRDSHVMQDKLVDDILTEDNQKVDIVVKDSNLLEVDRSRIQLLEDSHLKTDFSH
jgi:hypothetical protein